MQIEQSTVPTPYAHPHQAQVDSLQLGFLYFGVAGVLLSAVLVATMLNGLFAQQIPQIGIMKAIGARSGLVLQLYLLMTLVIAATATALAIVPGILISRAVAPAMLTLLGIKAVDLMAPWWMYAVVAAVACAHSGRRLAEKDGEHGLPSLQLPVFAVNQVIIGQVA